MSIKSMYESILAEEAARGGVQHDQLDLPDSSSPEEEDPDYQIARQSPPIQGQIDARSPSQVLHDRSWGRALRQRMRERRLTVNKLAGHIKSTPQWIVLARKGGGVEALTYQELIKVIPELSSLIRPTLLSCNRHRPRGSDLAEVPFRANHRWMIALEQLYQAQGLKQSEMAQQLGITAPTLSDLKRGRKPIAAGIVIHACILYPALLNEPLPPHIQGDLSPRDLLSAIGHSFADQPSSDKADADQLLDEVMALYRQLGERLECVTIDSISLTGDYHDGWQATICSDVTFDQEDQQLRTMGDTLTEVLISVRSHLQARISDIVRDLQRKLEEQETKVAELRSSIARLSPGCIEQSSEADAQMTDSSVPPADGDEQDPRPEPGSSPGDKVPLL